MWELGPQCMLQKATIKLAKNSWWNKKNRQVLTQRFKNGLPDPFLFPEIHILMPQIRLSNNCLPTRSFVANPINP